MRYVIDRIHRALAYHGLIGTLRLCVRLALRPATRCLAHLRKDAVVSQGSAAQDPGLEFDQRWGVETSGPLVTSKSEAVGANWIYGVKYQGCDAYSLDNILDELSIVYGNYTFIDFGSGKGRGVLIAARFPFKRIIGVEFSEELNRIAKQNLSRFPSTAKKCEAIEIVCGDAAAFSIPPGPLLMFLFNPFGEKVMKEVSRNVAESYKNEPRPMIVVYFNPRFARVWRDAGFMSELSFSKHIAVYSTGDIC